MTILAAVSGSAPTFASRATWIDLLIVLGYLALIMWIGIRFAHRQKTMKEYFLAGQNMGWLPVGLSLMGAIHSGIQYIQGPSVAIRFGLIFLIQILAWFIVYPWAMWIILPFYRRLGTFTCYEYLEQRFGAGVRSLAAVVFLLWRIGWISAALYVPALAVHAVSGGRVNLQMIIIILGAVVAISTMLGGMRAVIWTDVLQFAIMVGGLGLTLFMVIHSVPGGVAAIFARAHAAGKLTFFQSIPPEFRHSAHDQFKWLLTAATSCIGLPLAAVVGRMANYGTDQVMIQRFQTTRTLRGSRQALLVNAVSDVIWTLILAFVGISLFAYFDSVKPLPDAVRARATDFIFPYFMSEVFPTGVIGIVIATVFAASLATMGSALNSCSSVTIIDLYRFRPPRDGEAGGTQQRRVEVKSLAASRWLTLAYGAFATAIGTQLAQLGDLIEITNKVIQTFTGPLLGLYLLGMFTRRAHQTGALAGGILGTMVSIWLAFFTKYLPLFGVTNVGFIWPTVYGVMATVLSGYVISVVTPAPRRAGGGGSELTWRRVMSRPIPEGEVPPQPTAGVSAAKPAALEAVNR